MLTSITPLGERGRGQRWPVTAVALTLGHLAGGVGLGAVLAAGAAAVAAVADPSPATVTVVVTVVAVVAASTDVAGVRFPGRRQVDESWLTSYRGWVYGVGFGLQLGLGFVTVVNTALFGAMALAAVLLGPSTAFVLGVTYGGGRALMALLSGRVRSVEQLKRLHRRLDRLEESVGHWALGVVVVAGSVAMLG